MFIEGNHQRLVPVAPALLTPAIAACAKVDWSGIQFSRNEPSLADGRLMEFPFPISRHKRQRGDDEWEVLRACEPLLAWIRELRPFQGHRWIRGEVAALRPSVKLGWHIDNKWFHANCRRLHIPLITNEACVQLWRGERHHMEVGWLYELNNRVLHSAANEGQKARVHIILDTMSAVEYGRALACGVDPVRVEPAAPAERQIPIEMENRHGRL